MKLLTLLLIFSLTACDITNLELRKGNYFCKDKGGLNSITIFGEFTKFKCNNGESTRASEIKLIGNSNE